MPDLNSFVLQQKKTIESCKDTHLCLAGRRQGQHGGLGHRQAALMIVHTVGHVCPSQITLLSTHSLSHPGRPAAGTYM